MGANQDDKFFATFGRIYNDGDILFREGEPGDELFLIRSGQVEIIKMVGDTEKVLATIGEDSIFGEMAIFEDAPRSAGARAKGRLEVLVFDRNSFRIIFQLHPKWTMKLIEGFAGRITRAYKELEKLARAEGGI
ncbi:MAG: cyclic nucleotide-binding domain-containing protein [bacterium]